MTPRRLCAGFRRLVARRGNVRRSTGRTALKNSDLWFMVLAAVAQKRASAILDAERRRMITYALGGLKPEPWQIDLIEDIMRRRRP